MRSYSRIRTWSVRVTLLTTAAGLYFTVPLAGSIFGLHAQTKELQSQERITFRTTIRVPQESDHMLGDANAPVILIVFSDYLCPYCSVHHQRIKDLVLNSKGKVALVYRYFPVIHRELSVRMAQAAECIAEQQGEQGFWNFSNEVFEKHIQPAGLPALIKEMKGNETRYGLCMSMPPAPRIETDKSEIGKYAEATPYTIGYNRATKNSVAFSGARPISDIEELIKATSD